jgi:hypothetical protein
MAKKAYVRNSENTEWVELASATTDLTGYATETYVNTSISNLVDTAPTALNTLNELAAALGDDANFASTVTTALGNKLDSTTAASTYAPIVPATQTGFRNVLINGGFAIDQRNNGNNQNISSTLSYTVDRWYAYVNNLSSPFSGGGQRVAGIAPNQYSYRLSGAMGGDPYAFGQRIESANCFHLAGNNVTLSIDIASSFLTSITWTAFKANTKDSFGTLASPTKTQIATGTFTINSTLSRKTATFLMPSDATTGIEILFTTGSFEMGASLTFARAQLEQGTIATPFEQRPIGTELALCQRYYETGKIKLIKQNNDTLRQTYDTYNFKQNKRVLPVLARTITSSANVGYATMEDLDVDAFNLRWNSTSGTDMTLALTWTASAEL